MDSNVVLEKYAGEGKPTNEGFGMSYQEAVGSLIWLSTISRPDIAFAVHKIGQYSSNPGPTHWTALKRVFRYLSGTRGMRTTYGGPEFDHDLDSIYGIYSDADFASNPDDRKSISGFVVLLAGGPVAWSAKKQSTTALSTAESEYAAITHAARTAIWYTYLFNELGIPLKGLTQLYSDNQSAITLTEDPQFHARSKHFDIHNHFVREKVETGIIQISYCPTDDMVADIFTKALPRIKHQKFTKELGLIQA